MGNMCTGSERKPYKSPQHTSRSENATAFKAADFFGKKSAGDVAFPGKHTIEESFLLSDNFQGSKLFLKTPGKIESKRSGKSKQK